MRSRARLIFAFSARRAQRRPLRQCAPRANARIAVRTAGTCVARGAGPAQVCIRGAGRAASTRLGMRATAADRCGPARRAAGAADGRCGSAQAASVEGVAPMAGVAFGQTVARAAGLPALGAIGLDVIRAEGGVGRAFKQSLGVSHRRSVSGCGGRDIGAVLADLGRPQRLVPSLQRGKLALAVARGEEQ